MRRCWWDGRCSCCWCAPVIAVALDVHDGGAAADDDDDDADDDDVKCLPKLGKYKPVSLLSRSASNTVAFASAAATAAAAAAASSAVLKHSPLAKFNAFGKLLSLQRTGGSGETEARKQ